MAVKIILGVHEGMRDSLGLVSCVCTLMNKRDSCFHFENDLLFSQAHLSVGARHVQPSMGSQDKGK